MRYRISLVVALAICRPVCRQRRDCPVENGLGQPSEREREREEERERGGKRPIMSERSGPDEPEEMEDLTRELWKFARGEGLRPSRAPGECVGGEVRGAGAASCDSRPAGSSHPLALRSSSGALPYEAVSFGGRVVVLNNGYYPQGLEDPEISIVDVARPRRHPHPSRGVALSECRGIA